MIVRNYIKSAHRNVLRNKVQSVIQILSLAIGLTVFTLVALYLYDEFTIDRSNPNFHQVYRVEMPGLGWGADDVIPIPLAPEFAADVPEVSHVSRVRYLPSVATAYIAEEGSEARQTILDGLLLVDSGFFHIFPQEFIRGDPAMAFDEPYTALLTESASKRLFGTEDPMGKTIYTWNSVPNRVIGVIRDPVNTHLKYEMLIPFSSMYFNFIKNGRSTDPSHLVYYSYPCYVALHPGADVAMVESKMEEVWMRFAQQIFSTEDEDSQKVHLRSLAEVHFADIDPTKDYMSHVNRKNLVNFFFLGLGILLLGMINYINLSTARASRRIREVAMRKVNGSTRGGLIFYFLIESVLTTFFAFLVAITLVQLLFAPFNYLLQSDINLHFLSFPWVWIVVFLGIILLGILAGIYPALKISKEAPLAIFSGDSQSRGSGLITRRILMIIQFSSAVILLIGIFSMQSQIRYMQTRDLGFNTEQVVHIGTANNSAESKLELIRRLETIPEVESACLSQPVPGLNNSDDVPVIDDPESIFYGLAVKVVMADINFFEVYDLKFTQGGEILDQSALRNFSTDTLARSREHFYVINESCRKALGLDDAVGVSVAGAGPGGIIAGVIEDFHFQSLKFEVKPMLIWIRNDGSPWHLSIKINSPDMVKTIRDIEDTMRGLVPEEGERIRSGLPPSPVEFKFVDETFSMQYEKVERLQTASSYLSFMAVLIACLGLFGLSTFMAQRRIKEIGIRKAMGASDEGVFLLLAKDFLKWVSFSAILGLPLGILIMQQWQQQFAYKARFGIWIYLLTILIVLVVSLATVAWQSLKASRTNPVDSLRTE